MKIKNDLEYCGIKGEYRYICDQCKEDSGAKTLIWKELPDRDGHFCLCFNCLKEAAVKHLGMAGE